VDALAAAATAHACELVIVDNGSSDGTREYLESFKGSAINRLLVKSTFEAKPGLGRARNTGWRTASANIIAFTDDDIYVANDWVDSISAIFEENPETGFVGGPVLLYDSTDYNITVRETRERILFRPQEFIYPGWIGGGNMVFKRSALERIGGFDQRMGAGTQFPCEDVDVEAAALWAGVPGLYDPRMVVYHHHGRKTEREAQQLMRSYDKGRGAYYAKYILKKASRGEYSRAWIGSVKHEFVSAIRGGRFPTMGRSLRELSSGLRFVVSGLFEGAH